jgi:5-methylcytosine-specific restriction enzyme A
VGVIIQPCRLSSPAVRRHYVDTIHQTVDVERACSMLTPADAQALRNVLGQQELRLWGVKPGLQNDPEFAKLRSGDQGLLYGDKLIFASFEVLHVFETPQPDLARELWGEVDGETWAHMYALNPLTEQAIPVAAVRDALGREPGSTWIPRAFKVHSGRNADRLAAMQSSDWEVRHALLARFGLLEGGSAASSSGRTAGHRALLKKVARDHVLAAIAEHDSIGQEEFLEKYGFGQPSRYWLVHEGRRYASKAILGVAAGFVPGEEALKASEFSGGLAETLRILKQIGFQASSTLGQLKVGDWHEDRRVISALYGGNPQAGITRFPDGHPSLFSHHNGPYEDERPSTEHDFVYRGQGATGTQTLSSGGNKLLEHARKTQLACRFWHQGTDGRFTFFAWVAVVGRTWVPVQQDGATVGHQISWILQPVPSPDVREWPERAQVAAAAEEAADDSEDTQPPLTPQSYADLCDDIDNRPPKSGRRRQRPARNDYERSEKARRAVRQRATACENPACTGMPPDVGTDGGPLLDVDHVRPLSRGGADHPSNMIAICPNCHRAKTFGRKARAWEAKFLKVAQAAHKYELKRNSG